MGNFGCLVKMAELLVGLLGGSFMKVDLDGVVNKKRATLGFRLKMMLVEIIFVSDPCKLHISYENIPKID